MVVELPRSRGQLSAFESKTFLSSLVLMCKRGVRGAQPPARPRSSRARPIRARDGIRRLRARERRSRLPGERRSRPVADRKHERRFRPVR